MHWAQDSACCSHVTSINEINGTEEFKPSLSVTLKWAELCKVDSEQVGVISKATDPQQLCNERKWADWEPVFINYLSTNTVGVLGTTILCHQRQ